MKEVQKAASLRAEGHVPGAIGHFRPALDLAPGAALAICAPALTYGSAEPAFLATGPAREALVAPGRSIRLQPGFCVGYYGTRRVHCDDGRFGKTEPRLGLREDALAELERCVVLGPQTDEGRRGQAFLDGGP